MAGTFGDSGRVKKAEKMFAHYKNNRNFAFPKGTGAVVQFG